MRHPKYGVQNFLIRLALEDQEIKVFGDCSDGELFMWTTLSVVSLLLGEEKEVCLEQVYSIGSAESVTFLELVQAILRACGSGRYVHAPWPEERQAIEVVTWSRIFPDRWLIRLASRPTLLAEGFKKPLTITAVTVSGTGRPFHVALDRSYSGGRGRD